MQAIKLVPVLAGQNIWDIAQQEYGSAEGVILILQANPELSVTDELAPGRVLNIWTEKAIQTLSEIISVQPFGSQLHSLLQAWALLIVNNNVTVNPPPPPPPASDAIVIPRLKLESGLLEHPLQNRPRRDSIRCWWESHNPRFLDYNPEVWLFKRRSYSKRKLRNEELGSEILHSGFDNPAQWDCGENVNINEGSMHFDDAADGSTGTRIDANFFRYRYYEVAFEIKSYVSGGVIMTFGNAVGELRSDDGIYSARVKATNFDPELVFTASGTTQLRITNVSVKQYIRFFDNTLKKRWAHEPHLNGIKYPGFNFYTGETSSEVTELAATGRHTEFPLTALATRQKMVLPLNQYEYFHAQSISQNRRVLLSDEIDLSDCHDLKCAGKQNLSTSFRIAIVIDNPDSTSQVKKIIGDLSDEFWIRTKVSLSPTASINSVLFRYRYNAVISKWTTY
ncbi:MAG: hypothetical protein CVT94_13460 [Bacteroidetes bacterium HGW-Bacteroidetes-11]|jgi:hypothetical protein|nr:MAG: hypothetical protein CVT94_13460 [Bacteroidetes bacterium HGW-Bacteroidetes-11]